MKRLTTDETLNAQNTTEAVPALAPLTYGLQLDLAGEELPEHLARLRGVVAEERGHITDLFPQSALEVPGVLVRLVKEGRTVRVDLRDLTLLHAGLRHPRYERLTLRLPPFTTSSLLTKTGQDPGHLPLLTNPARSIQVTARRHLYQTRLAEIEQQIVESKGRFDAVLAGLPR